MKFRDIEDVFTNIGLSRSSISLKMCFKIYFKKVSAVKNMTLY